jgi:hypothetical protein
MIKWGSTTCTVIKWGSTTCTAVYWGSTKVFPASYVAYNGSTFSGDLAGGLVTGFYNMPEGSYVQTTECKGIEDDNTASTTYSRHVSSGSSILELRTSTRGHRAYRGYVTKNPVNLSYYKKIYFTAHNDTTDNITPSGYKKKSWDGIYIIIFNSSRNAIIKEKGAVGSSVNINPGNSLEYGIDCSDVNENCIIGFFVRNYASGTSSLFYYYIHSYISNIRFEA